MARFLFNTRDNNGVVSDADGYELSSVAEAHTQAIMLSGELIKDMALTGDDASSLSVWVADERGTVVCSINFHAACGDMQSPGTPG